MCPRGIRYHALNSTAEAYVESNATARSISRCPAAQSHSYRMCTKPSDACAAATVESSSMARRAASSANRALRLEMSWRVGERLPRKTQPFARISHCSSHRTLAHRHRCRRGGSGSDLYLPLEAPRNSSNQLRTTCTCRPIVGSALIRMKLPSGLSVQLRG
jgi:hypothetical protein